MTADGTGGADIALLGDPVASAGNRVLLRGGTWNAGAQFAPLVVNLVLTPYVIHGLGVARFGLYVLATSIADFLGTFDGGLYASSQRYYAVYAGTGDTRRTSRLTVSLTLGVVLLGVVMVAVLYLLASPLLSLFHVPLGLRAEGHFLLRVLGVVIALELLRGVFAALLNARQRFAISSLTTVLQYAVYTVGVVLTIQTGAGLRGIGLTMVAMTLLSTVVLAVPAARYLDRHALRPMPRTELREFLGYAGNAQVAGLSDLINLQSDAIFVGAFLSVRSVTFYSSGRNFASQMRAVPLNAVAPASALLGKVYGEGGREAALAQFRGLQRSWVQACTGWIAVAAAAAWFGVTRWLGDGFELAGTVAVVLVVGYAFRLWVQMLTVFCQAVGRPELEARYGFVSVAVNIVLTLALVVPFGVVGVVAGTALGQALGAAYLLRAVRLRLGDDVPSFLPEIPWTAAALSAAVAGVLELVARPVITEGPLGLLEAGLVAAPGLVVFGLVLLGPSTAWRRTRSLAGSVRHA